MLRMMTPRRSGRGPARRPHPANVWQEGASDAQEWASELAPIGTAELAEEPARGGYRLRRG
jgi:hypothetical protein